jgi:CheY-like chemotaxis protein/HPt (histidine-containing phosphotransfer) domain-containing protein
MKKILIVEDDQIVANIYRNKFSVEGFQVEVASDGVSGLGLVESFRPDAVVLDLMLPKMTGVEFMKQVRAHSEFKALPVIVFSNTYLTNMVQEAWKAGATKCLSKANCTPNQVIEVLRGMLGNGQRDAQNGTAAASPSRVATPAKTNSNPPTNTTVFATEADFQAGLLKSFRDGMPATMVALRTQLQGLFKAVSEDSRLKSVQEIYRRIHAVTGNAAAVGLTQIASVADALEALLKELYEKPKNINVSTLRTVASTIDFLGVLCERGLDPAHQEMPPANILVVDDEAISRRAVTHALEKAKLKSVNTEDPAAAIELLKKNTYDLVILDVDMPGMNGFELCAKLRTLPAYKKTPVVFVTGLNDFESRANSTMSGGNDFIAKPFLFMELAVKALVFIVRSRMS